MSTKIEVERQPCDAQPEFRVRVTEFGEVVNEIARFWRREDANDYASFLSTGCQRNNPNWDFTEAMKVSARQLADDHSKLRKEWDEAHAANNLLLREKDDLRDQLKQAMATIECLAKERDAWKSCWSAWKRKAEEAEAKLVPNPDYVDAPKCEGGAFVPRAEKAECPTCGHNYNEEHDPVLRKGDA